MPRPVPARQAKGLFSEPAQGAAASTPPTGAEIKESQPKPPMPERQWYVLRGPRREGPYSQANIIIWIEEDIVSPATIAMPVGSTQQKALTDWPEFASAIQKVAAAALPPSSPPPPFAPTVSVPSNSGEQVGGSRNRLPGLKRVTGERLRALREKFSGLETEEVVGWIRRLGDILFALVCWLLIEAWALCVATKDQTVRLAAYAVKRFKARRKHTDTESTTF